jgi:hypothetical protein
MPKENPIMTPSYKTVGVEHSLVGQSNDGLTFPSFGFEVSQRWTEGPRAQKYSSAYALSKLEGPGPKPTIIFEHIQMHGDKISGNISDKKAGRRRQLSPEGRKKASDMRKIRACLRCRLSKVAVSSDYAICKMITISNNFHAVL